MFEKGKQDEIDVKDLTKGFGLDVIAKFVFAIELNSIKDKHHPFVKAVHKFVNFDGSFFTFLKTILIILLPAKLVKYFEIQFFDLDAMEYVADVTRKLIRQRNENPDENYNDFLGLLMRTIREKNLNVKEEEIIGNYIVFLKSISTI